MLACFVCVLPQRAALAVTIDEVTVATDEILAGNALNNLADEPAAANAVADAFLGELMVEAATATATADAGLFYAVLLDEPAHALDAWAGIYADGIDVDVTEAAAAAEAVDAAVPGAAARSAMTEAVFVNSSGVPRQAYANGIMLNL